jgi:hypothetical protein
MPEFGVAANGLRGHSPVVGGGCAGLGVAFGPPLDGFRVGPMATPGPKGGPRAAIPSPWGGRMATLEV